MNFSGFNRAALNGAASGMVAGAALVVALSGFAAQGVRTVFPASQVAGTGSVSAAPRLALLGGAASAASSSATAWPTRTTFGGGGLTGLGSLYAFPALLQLQSANMVVSSGLHATFTDAYCASNVSLAASGFITRPGGGYSPGVCSFALDPVVTVGYASNITTQGSLSADASVKLNGQATTQRDGYSVGSVISSLTAGGLKTALGYASVSSKSSCSTDSIKTHGGRASIDGVCTVTALASTDNAFIFGTSWMIATGVITRFGEVVWASSGSLSAEPTNTTQASNTLFEVVLSGQADGRLALLGEALISATLGVAGDPRLALLGVANITGVSTLEAFSTILRMATAEIGIQSSMSGDARLGLLGEAIIEASSNLTEDGRLYVRGYADVNVSSEVTAQWSRLIATDTQINVESSAAAFASTNAEAPDPDVRTMYRPFNDTAMARDFTDRVMQRTT